MNNIFRRQRHIRFLETFGIATGDDVRIIDVGGLPGTWEGTGLERNVTLFNLDPRPVSSSGHKWIQGDACDMSMILAGAFDIAFSNSVIEHVGGFEKQRQMAGEIQRVCRRYWVQTPYRHFPVEQHFVFPGFQYLPLCVKRIIAHWWPFSFAKKFNLNIDYEMFHIWSLDRPRFQALFETAEIIEERFMGLTKSLIAVRK